MNRRRARDDREDGDDVQAYKRCRQDGSGSKELETRLEKLILKVGEQSCTTLESNLEGLASVLDGNLPHLKKKILKILVDCAINMPEKCTVYSTLIGLLNAKSYDFVDEFVKDIVRTFKDNLKNNSWNEARILFRFIGDLVNCHVVSASSFIQLMNSFLNVIKEEGVPNVCKDWYCYAIISCLPWVGKELYEKKGSSLEILLITIEVYLSKRPKKHVNMLRIWSTDKPHPQEEYLVGLWTMVKKLKYDGWKETIIRRPYLAFDSILCAALQHHLPSIVPPSHHNACVYPMPWVVYRMFDYTDVFDGTIMPGTHSIERYLVEENLQQIIDKSYTDRKKCATNLINFVHKSQISLEHCIVEVIFGLMFHQPNPKYLEIMFGSLFIELSKLSTNTVPLLLAQTTGILYSRIESMHVSAFDRFVSWFAYHLSNFKFSWSWEEWKDCLALDPEHPKPKFVREVLLKAMRLSYYDRICDAVPIDFKPLLPENPIPKFKFAIHASNLPGQLLSNTLMTQIRNKSTAEDIIEILKETLVFENGKTMEPADNSLLNSTKIDAFVQTLFSLASKSILHAFSAITKFSSVFKALAETDNAQLQILQSTFDFWSANQQMLTIIIDKMLKLEIIKCSSVASWIFSEKMTSEFTKLYIWEILMLTLNNMSKHVDRLTYKLNKAREKLRTIIATSSSSDDSETEKAAKTKPSNLFTPTSGDQLLMDVDNNITEEMVEGMEEQFEITLSDQKNLFLIVFQRFIMILSEHLVKCDIDGKPYDTYWYKYTLGRLRQMFSTHHNIVRKYSNTLEMLVFTEDLDQRILEVFHEFLALHS